VGKEPRQRPIKILFSLPQKSAKPSGPFQEEEDKQALGAARKDDLQIIP